MNIIKKTNGLVVLENATGTYKNRSFTNASVSLRSNGTTFDVHEGGNLVYSFEFSSVVFTQIDPAAQVAAPATAYALLDLMQTSFFFEPVASGGIECISATKRTTTNVFSTIYQFSIPNNTTANCELQLNAKLEGSMQFYYVNHRFTIGTGVAAGFSIAANTTTQENFTTNPAFIVNLSANLITIQVHSGAAQNVNWEMCLINFISTFGI